MSTREVMQMALETFESLKRSGLDLILVSDNIAALKAELAKPEPEPAGFIWRWKAKVGELADVNPWQFRDVPVHQSNIGMLDLVPLYRKEDV